MALVEKYGSKSSRERFLVHPEPGVGNRDRHYRRRSATRRGRAIPPPGMACSAFSMTLVSARATSVRSA